MTVRKAGGGRGGRDALERKGPQTRPQRRLGRRLEEVAKAVGGSYCRLQMPLKLALAVRGTVAGHRLDALVGGGGGLGIRLFAFGGAYWPLATAHSDPVGLNVFWSCHRSPLDDLSCLTTPRSAVPETGCCPCR